MPEGDVKVYVELIPTEASMKKSAEGFVNEFQEKFKGLDLKDVLGKVGESLKGITGIGEGAGAAAGAGGVGGGAGGIIGLLGVIAGAVLALVALQFVVSAFFEAVGPIIKLLSKVLVVFFLLLLAPFIKRLAPVLGEVVKSIINTAKILGDILDFFLGGGTPGEVVTEGMDQAIADVRSALDVMKDAGDITDAQYQENIKILDNLQVVADKYQAFIDGLLSLQMFTDPLGFFGIPFEMLLATINAYFGTEFPTNLQTILGDALTAIYDALLVQWTLFIEQAQEGLNILVQDVFFNPIWKQIADTIDFMAEDVFGAVWNIIFNTIQSIAGALQSGLDAINSAVSAGQRLVGGIAGFVTGAFTGQDFVMRPGGQITSFSSDDTIIGVKNPANIGGANRGTVVNVSNTYNVDAGADATRLKKLFEENNRAMAKSLRDRLSYVGGFYA